MTNHRDEEIQDEELYELRDWFADTKTGMELLELAWKNSSKNAVANGYICGVADTLLWAGKITQKEYTDFLKHLGL